MAGQLLESHNSRNDEEIMVKIMSKRSVKRSKCRSKFIVIAVVCAVLIVVAICVVIFEYSSEKNDKMYGGECSNKTLLFVVTCAKCKDYRFLG